MHCHRLWIHSSWWSQSHRAWNWHYHPLMLGTRLQCRHASCWPRWRRLNTVFGHSLNRNRVQHRPRCVRRRSIAKGVHRRHLCRLAGTPVAIPQAAQGPVSGNCSRQSKIMSCVPAAAAKPARMRSRVALEKRLFDVSQAAFRSQRIHVCLPNFMAPSRSFPPSNTVQSLALSTNKLSCAFSACFPWHFHSAHWSNPLPSSICICRTNPCRLAAPRCHAAAAARHRRRRRQRVPWVRQRCATSESKRGNLLPNFTYTYIYMRSIYSYQDFTISLLGAQIGQWKTDSSKRINNWRPHVFSLNCN